VPWYIDKEISSLRTPVQVVHCNKQRKLTRYNKLSLSLVLFAQQIELTIKKADENLVKCGLTFVLLLTVSRCQAEG